MKARHDVTEVTRSFLLNQFGLERQELMAEFTDAVNHNEMLKKLIAEAGFQAVCLGNGPVGVMKLGMAYGLALGVFLERERRERERKVLI